MKLSLVYQNIIVAAAAAICFVLPYIKNKKLFMWINPAWIGISVTGFIGYCSVSMLLGKPLLPESDALTLFSHSFILLGMLLLFINYIDYPQSIRDRSYFCGFSLTSVIGFITVSSAQDYILLVIGLTIVTVSTFFLIINSGFSNWSEWAGLKLFFLYSCSLSLLIYGISLVFLSTGSVAWNSISTIPITTNLVLTIGVFCVFVSMLGMLGCAPIPWWVSDVLAHVSPITAGFLLIMFVGAFIPPWIRIFMLQSFPFYHHLNSIFFILVIAIITTANMMALFQKNLIFLFSYAAIAQTGYLLIGLLVGIPRGVEGMLIGAIAYGLAMMGIFSFLFEMRRLTHQHVELKHITGLAVSFFFGAFILLIFIISCVGIPLTAGFVSTWYIMSAVIEKQYYGIAMAVCANMVIASCYYGRLINYLFFKSAESPLPFRSFSKPAVCVILLCAFGIGFMGVYPHRIIELVRDIVRIIK